MPYGALPQLLRKAHDVTDPTFEVEETAVRLAREQGVSYVEALVQVQKPLTRTDVDQLIADMKQEYI